MSQSLITQLNKWLPLTVVHMTMILCRVIWNDEASWHCVAAFTRQHWNILRYFCGKFPVVIVLYNGPITVHYTTDQSDTPEVIT